MAAAEFFLVDVQPPAVRLADVPQRRLTPPQLHADPVFQVGEEEDWEPVARRHVLEIDLLRQRLLPKESAAHLASEYSSLLRHRFDAVTN